MKKMRNAFLFLLLSCSCTGFSRGQEEAYDALSCAVNGAAYGTMYTESSQVQQWAPLVGKACANSVPNTCFSDATEWSSVALEYGNRPVLTAQDCASLCATVDDCDVWTFWPTPLDDAFHKQPKCDLCPASQGGSFDPNQSFCTEEGDCSGICNEPYQDTATNGIPNDADYTCQDAQLWFANDIGCCTYDEQAKLAYQVPSACELYRASPQNSTNVVLAYYDNNAAVSGPKDCSSTLWLPFLEYIDNTVEDVVNYTSKGYCDMCPEEYGYQLLPTQEFCNPDGSCGICQDSYNSVMDSVVENGDCEASAEWFRSVAACCVMNQETTPEELPRASNGRLCWVDGGSYGSLQDGACAEADILAIYATVKTIEIGQTQEWWYSPVTGIAIEPIPIDKPWNVSECHQACMDNSECGGWQLQGGSCILKTALDCSPTIARTLSTNTTAGVSGCVDASSDNPVESLAVDTSNLWFFDCTRPRCTQPYSYGGSWTQDTFIPNNQEDACWYKQYTPDELFDDCVQDRWIIINGGSNSLSFFIHMVNLFARLDDDTQQLLIDFSFDTGVNLYPMIDIVFRRDSLPIVNRTSEDILHFNKKRFCDVDASLPCREYSLNWPNDQVDWPPAYVAALTNFLGEAPYEAGATRLTLVVGQFWGAATETLRAVGSVPQSSGWATSKVLFYGQAMTWYTCNINDWCEGPELGTTSEEMLSKYQSDLDGLFEVGQNVCDLDRVDCFFATQGYGSTAGDGESAMISALQKMTATYEWAHFIDYNGFMFDEEIVGGHLMPAMFLPVFSMLWNTVCDGPSVGCPQAISSSPICWSDCSERRDDPSEACSDCADSWECANQVRCDAQVLDPVPWQVAMSITLYLQPGEEVNSCFLAGEEVRERSLLVERRAEEESGSGGETVTDSCEHRIWCGTVAQGRIVGILVFLAAVAVIAYAQYRSTRAKKKKKQQEEKAKAQNGVECEKGIPLAIDIIHTGRTSANVGTESLSMTSTSEGDTDGDDSGKFDNFVTSVGKDGAVVVSLPPKEKLRASKVYRRSTASFAVPDRVQSGPVCVDDFDERSTASFAVPDRVQSGPVCVDDFDERSMASSEARDRIQSGPVCVDDFVDSILVRDGVGRVKPKPSTQGKLRTSFSHVDVENPAPALRSPPNASEPHGTISNKEPDKPKQAALSKDYLQSLGIARLLASVHIVLGHLYAKGAVAHVYFFAWGFTWVPWFFMLSGYVLTHARLNSRDPTKFDGPYQHIAKRLSTIFPMYAFGVFLSMLIRIFSDLSLPGYGVLIGQSFLMQSWVPSWTEQALLSHCWFLSNMVVYWAGFGIVYNWVRRFNLISTCAALAFISVLPWLLVIVPSISNKIDADWYSDHSWGSTDSANDMWTVMLKFHPIFYFHVFLFGMLLSVLRHRVKNTGNNTGNALTTALSCIIRFGATFGYLGLILVFTLVELQPIGYKLSARLSVLLPLQGLVLLGLSPLPQWVANKSLIDPLASLFALGPPWIGDVSYCQYILQFIMYDLFPVSQITNASYFLYLLGASMLSYKFIQEPAANTWRKLLPKKDSGGPVCFLPSLANARLIFIPPLVLALILIIGKAAYVPPRNNAVNSSTAGGSNLSGTNTTSVPDFVRIATESVDLKLNWTMASSTEEVGDRLLINPSMLFRYDENGNLEWIRAARAHAIEETTEQGWYEDQEVTEQLLRFESSITLSREAFVGDLSAGFDEEGIKSWGLDGVQPLSFIDSKLISHVGKGSAWNDICEPKPSFNRENSWLVRKQVSGPEDPKLVQLSSDPDSSWGITFSSFPPASLLTESSSQEECKWADEAVMQMYLAEDGTSLASGGEAHGAKLRCGEPKGMEKNWIAFSHDDALYYVYSIEPHVIVQVRTADGACVEQYATSSGDMKKLSKRVSAIRGSATAIRYSETEYLALLHTREPSIGYATHAYTFETKPPFAVRRISKKIPLQGGGRAFPSSLSVIHDKVLIGYGDDDKVARVFVMSRTALEDAFDWCSTSV